MSYFLLIYDRPAGKLIRLREFPDDQRAAAYKERRELEGSKKPHIEVVVLEPPPAPTSNTPTPATSAPWTN